MRKWFSFVCMMTCLNYVLSGQDRFFTFVEGWQASTIVENDSNYTIIGSGFNTIPEYIKHIQFTRLNKLGNHLSSWTYLMDSTITTEIRNQQSFSIYNGIPIVGVTVKTVPEEQLIAKRLHLSSDLSQITDSSWQYIPNPNGAIMYGTLQTESNKIIHSIKTYNAIQIRSRLIQTDVSSNLEWENIFSCSGYCNMLPRHIIPAHDGGYLFTNEEERRIVNGGGPGDHEIGTIIKVDSLGNQEWRIYPGGTGFPYTSENILVVPTDDGNYLCAWTDNAMRNGTLNISYITNSDATIWFAKIAPDGTKLWEKNIQQEIELWGIDESKSLLTQMINLPDGNIILVGKDRIIKISQDAEVIWGRSIIPTFIDESDPSNFIRIKGVTHTSDNGFICAGEAWIYPGDIFPDFTQTGFVIKVDEYGCLEPDCHLNDPVSTTNISANYAELKLFPNPAKDYITIEYNTVKPAKFIAVNITDLGGRVVYAEVLEGQEEYLTIPTKDLPLGQYFCQLIVDGSMGATRKFVIAR